ncbi:hypothetical protein N0V88_006861 [Collariella sp. IMI 366227]|nr:hypothetical protein N0V88_006861 [Collariella sp. IMI 366227]
MVTLPIQTLLIALTAPLANLGVAIVHPALSSPRAAYHHPLFYHPLTHPPLGASITYGVGSSDGNGYRLPLRTALISAGNVVNMVGSRQAGTMRDNDVEGWPGLRIEQVAEKALGKGRGLGEESVVGRWRPNVVLVNVGTNDAAQGYMVEGAGERMEGKMANVWIKGLVEVAAAGWLQPPEYVTGVPDDGAA